MKRKLAMLLAAVVVFLGFTGCEVLLELLGIESGPGVVLTVEIVITNSDSVRVSIKNDGTESAINVEFKLYLTNQTNVLPSDPMVYTGFVDVPPKTPTPVVKDVPFDAFTVPANVQGGSYYIGVIIDRNGTIVKDTSADTYTYGGITTPPATPTGLNVTGTTDSSISLSWSASIGATGYEVYRNNSADGSFANKVYDNTATSMSDSTLSPNTTYYYKVLAKNSAGSSDLSSPAVPGMTQTSGGALATPGNFRVTSTTATSIALAWDEVEGATAYLVEWSDAEDGAYVWEVYDGPFTYATDSGGGLYPGTTNFYRVTAYNATETSDPSATLTVITNVGVGGDAYEPDNDVYSATQLSLDVPQVHTMDPATIDVTGDKDWYALTVVDGQSYRVETSLPALGTGIDIEIYLYNEGNSSAILLNIS